MVKIHTILNINPKDIADKLRRFLEGCLSAFYIFIFTYAIKILVYFSCISTVTSSPIFHIEIAWNTYKVCVLFSLINTQNHHRVGEICPTVAFVIIRCTQYEYVTAPIAILLKRFVLENIKNIPLKHLTASKQRLDPKKTASTYQQHYK